MDEEASAEAARKCAALRHASALANWVGAGRPVTAKRVLRRADVPSAAPALGVTVPQWVRSAADVPALHYPWTAALAVGLLSISAGRAVPGPALARWRSVDGGEVLDGWSRGLAAALADTFDDGDWADALEIGRLVLTVLATDPTPTGADLMAAIDQTVIASDYALYRSFDRFGHRQPAEVALELLAAFGAVTEAEGRWRITPLGCRARQVLSTRGVSLLGSPDAETEADGMCQLKITLRHVQPACWRRLLVPATATLGDLHRIIQVAFCWDDEHLHAFTVDRRQYGDPYFDLDDENTITLAAAFARAHKPISYVYDLGDTWQHDVTLEKTVEPDPAATYPICVDGRGDAPVEDWVEGEPAWISFDRAGINTRLTRAGGGPQIEARLRNDIEVIVTDAYGRAEEMTAFQTVLQEEIDFPVPATLLGEPVIVTGLTDDDATLELRARCRGKTAEELILLTDLEFRPSTVEAWLHAAYLGHLGRPFRAPTPPTGWDGLDRWRS